VELRPAGEGTPLQTQIVQNFISSQKKELQENGGEEAKFGLDHEIAN
jgi:hypothetical protein